MHICSIVFMEEMAGSSNQLFKYECQEHCSVGIIFLAFLHVCKSLWYAQPAVPALVQHGGDWDIVPFRVACKHSS